MTDHAQLIQACARGDTASLRSIMEAEGGRMLGVTKRMLRRLDLAEDAVQDSFVIIWQRAGQFDQTRGAAKGWLYTILRNRCLTMLRNNSWEIPTETEIMERLQDSDIIAEAYDRLDSSSDLRRCLDGLDDTKRSAVLLAYVLGYSHGEIAGRVQAPLGSIKAWVRRGLAQLLACLS